MKNYPIFPLFNTADIPVGQVLLHDGYEKMVAHGAWIAPALQNNGNRELAYFGLTNTPDFSGVTQAQSIVWYVKGLQRAKQFLEESYPEDCKSMIVYGDIETEIEVLKRDHPDLFKNVAKA